MAATLEQKRAEDAWRVTAGRDKGYSNLAKSLPALIMNSGLMQVLAFLNEKGCDKQGNIQPLDKHTLLGDHLRAWLAKRFSGRGQFTSPAFPDVMKTLFETSDPLFFQQVSAEAIAWLRWVRQIAPARNAKSKE